MNARNKAGSQSKRTQKAQAKGKEQAPGKGVPEMPSAAEEAQLVAENLREQAIDEAWEKQVEEARKQAQGNGIAEGEPGWVHPDEDPGEEADEGYYCPICGGPDCCSCGAPGYSGHP